MKLKSILGSFALLGLGGLIGYITAKRILSEQYREDIEDVQEFYYERLRELGVMDADFEAEIMEEPERPEKKEETTDDVEDKKRFEKLTRTSIEKTEPDKGRPIIKYNKPPIDQILNKREIDPADEEDEYNGEDPDEYTPSDDPDYEEEIDLLAQDYAKRRAENESNGLPYVINHDEYLDGPEEYEKQCLYYYAKDRVLCEDDDSIVEDEEELIGFDYEDTLDMQTIAWVRNDTVAMLYEIHRVDDSYASAVRGVVETPREREFRIKGRRKAAIDNY